MWHKISIHFFWDVTQLCSLHSLFWDVIQLCSCIHYFEMWHNFAVPTHSFEIAFSSTLLGYDTTLNSPFTLFGGDNVEVHALLTDRACKVTLRKDVVGHSGSSEQISTNTLMLASIGLHELVLWTSGRHYFKWNTCKTLLYCKLLSCFLPFGHDSMQPCPLCDVRVMT
jgi:hypothetical protein